MKRMMNLLAKLPEPARGRVVSWLGDKYHASHENFGPSDGKDVN